MAKKIKKLKKVIVKAKRLDLVDMEHLMVNESLLVIQSKECDEARRGVFKRIYETKITKKPILEMVIGYYSSDGRIVRVETASYKVNKSLEVYLLSWTREE